MLTWVKTDEMSLGEYVLDLSRRLGKDCQEIKTLKEFFGEEKIRQACLRAIELQKKTKD